MMMLVYPTVVIALEAAFDRPFGELLSLSFVGFVLYGVAALPAGWLGDRWSAPGMLAVFFIGTGAAGIAAGFASGPFGIAIALGAIGLFSSIYHPVGTAWVVANARARGKALGINGVFGTAELPPPPASGCADGGVWVALCVYRAWCGDLVTGIAFLFVVKSMSSTGVTATGTGDPIIDRSQCSPRARDFGGHGALCRFAGTGHNGWHAQDFCGTGAGSGRLGRTDRRWWASSVALAIGALGQLAGAGWPTGTG